MVVVMITSLLNRASRPRSIANLSADRGEAFAESIQPRCLSLTESHQLFSVAGFGFTKLAVDHGELFPLFDQRPGAGGAVAAAPLRPCHWPSQKSRSSAQRWASATS